MQLLNFCSVCLCIMLHVPSSFPSLLAVSLSALSRKLCLQGEWLSPRVINLSLQYLTHGLTLSATWKHMKQHINALLTRCVLPLMCFNDEDDELWREDPQEYIRKVLWTDTTSQQDGCCCCLSLLSAVLLLWLAAQALLQIQRVCVTFQILMKQGHRKSCFVLVACCPMENKLSAQDTVCVATGI